ncbi:hypothetical protein [Arenimonas daejeonensis]|nr:hypothetical protein [Arenimonas daejeonensis]
MDPTTLPREEDCSGLRETLRHSPMFVPCFVLIAGGLLVMTEAGLS